MATGTPAPAETGAPAPTMAPAVPEDCTPVTNGTAFDLTALDNHGVGHTVSDAAMVYDFTIAFCSPLFYSPASCAVEPGVAVCQEWTAPNGNGTVTHSKVPNRKEEKGGRGACWVWLLCALNTTRSFVIPGCAAPESRFSARPHRCPTHFPPMDTALCKRYAFSRFLSSFLLGVRVKDPPSIDFNLAVCDRCLRFWTLLRNRWVAGVSPSLVAWTTALRSRSGATLRLPGPDWTSPLTERTRIPACIGLAPPTSLAARV